MTTTGQGRTTDDPATFDDVAATLSYPMYVVTTAVEGERSGCLVGFASQSSIDPPRFTVWISAANHTAEVAARAEILAVHVLRRDQIELARHFGEVTGDEIDKFQAVAWDPGPGDAPILDGCDWFAGRVVERVELVSRGDHHGYVLEPVAAGLRRSRTEVLRFDDVRSLDAGHDA
jgi:flavin reductase (DIM6/NTAB) family NADH-FMN oxidoreductase RutF